jgi:hypothetical protein
MCTRASATRRRSFAKELERRARVWGDEVSQTYEFAFRRRYNLPPTDPRFLNATVEEIVVDFHANRFWDDPKLRQQEVVSDDFEAQVAAMEAMIAEKAAAREAAANAEATAQQDRQEGIIASANGLPPPGDDDWEVVAEDRF